MAASRRLAAVMITDMVGFATVTQRSESTALRLLEEHRELVRGTLGEFHGREVKTLGDGFLVEFGSALSATECAVEIQRRLDERNRSHREARIDLRIGIHLGEVVPEGTDILGDAVNIASRLEPLAEPGGVLISGPVRDQVEGRLGLNLQALPTPALKHILVPIAIYRVELPWKAPPLPEVTSWTDREEPFAALVQALDRARQGHGSAALILGEPGTGKSRLLEEVLRGTERGGVQVLRGQATRSERTVPYALWSEAIRSYSRHASPAVLARACGPHLAEVARLVPEIVEQAGASAPPASAEPELAEDRLAEGIVGFLGRLAAEAPLVVALDDVQWSDPYSQRLLRRAMRAVAGRRWLVLAAARDRDPSESPGFADLVADSRREPACRTLSLARFGPAEFDRFLDALLPAPGLAPAVRKRFHERCDGNPWFAEELLRRQLEVGALRRSPDGWTIDASEELRVPETVHQLLRERLDVTDPATLQVLRTASVIGSRWPFPLLQKVSGVPDDLLMICVERAVQAGLLVERAGPGGEIDLAFRDTLTRDVLYEGLSLVRARGYHRTIAQALEQLPERDRREQASRLAEHFLKGGLPGPALDYALLAAGRAVEVHAHPEAEHFYRTALDLMDELPATDGRRPETARALAKELELLGRTSEALERYEQASRLWEEAGDRRKASSVHSWMAMLLNDLPGRATEVVAHSEKAVALLAAEGETAELAQATYSLAAETLRWGGDVARARELFRKSVELAVRFGDTRTEAWGTYFLALALPFSQKNEAIALADQLAAKLETTDDPTLPGILYNVGVNLFLDGKGDVAAARRYLERAREVVRQKGVHRHATAIALGLAEIDRVSGAWKAAEAVARDVLSHEPEENLLERVEASFLLARLATARGRLEEAARLLADLEGPRFRSLLASPEATLPWAVIRAEYEVEAGRPDRARSLLAPVLQAGSESEPTFSAARTWATALQLGIVLAGAGSGTVGGEPYVQLLRRLAEELDEPWIRAWRFQAEGVVAERATDASGAVAAFERSVREWERANWPLETGKALYLLGEAERRAGLNDRAHESFDRAAALFGQLGADRYAHQALIGLRGR